VSEERKKKDASDDIAYDMPRPMYDMPTPASMSIRRARICRTDDEDWLHSADR
jgi:hypothetical protein